MHQFGEARAKYFFSMIVATFLFFGGGVIGVMEAYDKLVHPAHTDKPKPINLLIATKTFAPSAAKTANIPEGFFSSINIPFSIQYIIYYNISPNLRNKSGEKRARNFAFRKRNLEFMR